MCEDCHSSELLLYQIGPAPDRASVLGRFRNPFLRNPQENTIYQNVVHSSISHSNNNIQFRQSTEDGHMSLVWAGSLRARAKDWRIAEYCTHLRREQRRSSSAPRCVAKGRPVIMALQMDWTACQRGILPGG